MQQATSLGLYVNFFFHGDTCDEQIPWGLMHKCRNSDFFEKPESKKYPYTINIPLLSKYTNARNTKCSACSCIFVIKIVDYE